MKRLGVVLALAPCVLATSVLAQEPMRPGPQHARIGYFAGTWQFEGQAMESPMAPAGPVSVTETCEWFEGNFQLICRSDMTGPRGRARGQSIWTYDPGQQRYTLYGFNSLGDSFYVTGSVDGRVWTWLADVPMGGGQTMTFRATVIEDSPTAYTYRLEVSADGTTWAVAEQGQGSKRAMR